MQGPDPTGPIEPDLSTRVTRVETSVDTLHQELGEVKIALTTQTAELKGIMGNNTDKTDRAIRELAGSLSQSRQTNWSMVISAMSLVVVLVGAIGTALIMPLNRTTDFVLKEQDRQREKVEQMTEMTIRNDERMKVYRERSPYTDLH